MEKQHNHTPKDGEKMAILGIIANIGLTIIKFLWGIFGNSYALIADAIESASDILGSGIVYLGVRYAQKPADANHPYGHGKTEPMAGLAVSLLLIFAIYQIAMGAIERIKNPEIGIPELWTLWILIFVVILKWFLFVRGIVIGKNLKSTAVIGDAWHHLSDAITTGIALVGTLIALFAGPSFMHAADWAALVASFFMLYNVWHIGFPAFRELLDEVDDPEMEQAVRSTAMSHAQVKNVNHLTVRKSGFDRIVEIHLLVNGELTVRIGHLIAHEVETEIKKKFPNVQTVIAHIEPDYEVVE